MASASATVSSGICDVEAAWPVVVDIHVLAGEHAQLLRNVERRAAPVLALLDARVWPHAELGALLCFLRDSVLRQVSDEEAWMFPPGSSAPPLAELSADHVRLHTLTARVEQAYRRPCSRDQLRTLLDDLVRTLRQHLAEEQIALFALPHLRTDESEAVHPR